MSLERNALRLKMRRLLSRIASLREANDRDRPHRGFAYTVKRRERLIKSLTEAYAADLAALQTLKGGK